MTDRTGVCSVGRMAHTDLPPTLTGVPALTLRLIGSDERPRFDQLL